MTTDYLLRTYTAGCYYLDEKYEEWTGQDHCCLLSLN